MTDNVKHIYGGPAPLEPAPKIIEALEEALKDAKNGKIRALAIATYENEGGPIFGTDFVITDGTPAFLLVAIETLKYRFMAKYVEGKEL